MENPDDLPSACKKYKDTNPEKYANALADDEYYCHFVYQETFEKCTWAGAVATGCLVVVVVIVVIARDFLKVFDCCGEILPAGTPLFVQQSLALSPHWSCLSRPICTATFVSLTSVFD